MKRKRVKKTPTTSVQVFEEIYDNFAVKLLLSQPSEQMFIQYNRMFTLHQESFGPSSLK